MKHELNRKLAAGCSAIVLTACLATSAQAFDVVNWVWNADVVTTVDTSLVAVTELEPTGLNQVENEQDMSGNVASSSSVNDFTSLPATDPLGVTVETDTASIETGAQALGNSAAIESDVSINFDSIQTFSGADPDTVGLVTADSEAIGITNATVDSSATAVVNNLTVDLVYANSADALSIGNNVQTATADVNSSSTVDTVSITGLSILGGTETLAVQSNATAVGNNFTVNVSQPEPAAIDPVIPI